jgi:TPR repeat protein
MTRPSHIELPSEGSRSASALSRSNVSPRIQHFDGDVPPALSPLDAIAARSRRLAKELEETRKAGERRMSRLPPQIVTDSLVEHQNNRPQIFRALSDGIDVVPPLPVLDKERTGNLVKVLHPINRPTSQRICMSGIATKPFDQARKRRSAEQDYFGAPRVESPPPLEEDNDSSLQQQSDINRHLPVTSNADSLAPPRTHSDRLRPHQDSDDDYTSSNAGSTFSRPRQLSASSGVSGPHSPLSPYPQSHGRNSSNTSLDSPNRPHLARNFSRPMSSASLSNVNGEKTSSGSSANRLSQLRSTSSFDNASSTVEGYLAGEASSYTHTTFGLPHRQTIRQSQVFTPLSTPHFEWREPMFPATPPLEAKSSSDMPVPSPLNSARPSRDDHQRTGLSFELHAERSKIGLDHVSNEVRTPTGSIKSNDSSRPSLTGQLPPPPSAAFMYPPAPLSPVEEMSYSSRSASTVRPATARPTTSRSTSNYQGLSSDEQVAKAIELHQQGKLSESTYQMRQAAHRGHPTAMLLYALACRHGWGMRANPTEGVSWLRKAVDSAMLEITEDDDPSAQRPGVNGIDKKAHRAEFALSVYELGVSHLNGWGIEMDKALALRCFEIAGNWGDTDALSEAAFCYAEGIGCKKDLKKAAKFYRKAEAKGVSMVGNSW